MGTLYPPTCLRCDTPTLNMDPDGFYMCEECQRDETVVLSGDP